MHATAPAWETDGADRTTSITRCEAQSQDAYWRHRHAREAWFRAGFEYEDYAPACCVGYAGWAQYGGSFADAERSLWANWERIKGSSRLSLQDALPAMRAAWERMAQLQAHRLCVTSELAAVAPALPHGAIAASQRIAALALEA